MAAVGTSRVSARAAKPSQQNIKDGHPDRTVVLAVGATRVRMSPEESRDLMGQLATAAAEGLRLLPSGN